MHHFGERLGQLLHAGDLVLLTGELGAGKTTLTRGIGDGLQVRGPITSPTFVLARTHPSLGAGPALVHVDAYRLQDSGELEDLDLDFERSVVIAEWGAGLVDAASVTLEIVITRATGANLPAAQDAACWDEVDSDEPRQLQLRVHAPRLQNTHFAALVAEFDEEQA